MPTSLIISPSGHFYGSEQVLCDYLYTTTLSSDVFVPKQGKLKEILSAAPGPHRIFGFGKNILWLYLRVMLKLALGQYKTVYINEAGHIKYIQALAAVFRRVKFVVHVRILEDTNTNRWSVPLPDNLVGISVSKYIQDLLPVKSLLLHDIYKFNMVNADSVSIPTDGPLRISIIGRITASKGIKSLLAVLEQLKRINRQDEFVFRLFGDLSITLEDAEIIKSLRLYSNVIFEGFESNKDRIYSQSDLVFHFSTQESLGRIFIESIDYLKPFVGFNKAGIGEIGQLTGLSQFLLNPDDPLWIDQAIQIFSIIRDHYKDHVSNVVLAKNRAQAVFSATNYTLVLDKILSV